MFGWPEEDWKAWERKSEQARLDRQRQRIKDEENRIRRLIREEKEREEYERWRNRR